ncbi:hypothetical protein SLS56_006845 [Neofusicoccum ribis]|uniref:C6 zinc finger domain protein n=1 Tax=Neofusicoccum ribis TaxID=45134 RepID=A0ABR3SQI9_9PEZI
MAHFVDNNNGGSSSSSSSSAQDGKQVGEDIDANMPTSGGVVLDLRSRQFLEGGSYHRMRICQQQAQQPQVATPVPGSRVDLLVARLVSLLGSSKGTGHDLQFVGPSICQFPPRLAESVALQDATECLLFAHDALLRREEPESLIDPGCYGRALRSLQRALDDPQERYLANTLAATGLLQKTEGAFSAAGRMDFGVTHAGGIYACMKGRGLPQSDDEFEMLLCIEAGGLLVQFCMFNDRDPFVTYPEWVQIFDAALNNGIIKDDIVRYQHRLQMQMLYWPGLVKSLRRIHEGISGAPSEPGLLLQAIQVAQELQNIDLEIISQLRQRGDIIEAPNDGTSPFPWVYEFSGHDVARLFIHHAMASISINRIVEQLVTPADAVPNPTFGESNIEWSRCIWLSCSFARRAKPLQCIYLVTPLIVSFEAADSKQREWIKKALYDIQDYPGGMCELIPYSDARAYNQTGHQKVDLGTAAFQLQFILDHWTSPETLRFLEPRADLAQLASSG